MHWCAVPIFCTRAVELFTSSIHIWWRFWTKDFALLSTFWFCLAHQSNFFPFASWWPSNHFHFISIGSFQSLPLISCNMSKLVCDAWRYSDSDAWFRADWLSKAISTSSFFILYIQTTISSSDRHLSIPLSLLLYALCISASPVTKVLPSNTCLVLALPYILNAAAPAFFWDICSV